MGMTEVQKLAKIKVLEDLYKEYELLAKYNGGRDYDRYCALEVAIDTMRKYEKIEQIYKEWFSDKDRTGADAYIRIGEILKDGNVD